MLLNGCLKFKPGKLETGTKHRLARIAFQNLEKKPTDQIRAQLRRLLNSLVEKGVSVECRRDFRHSMRCNVKNIFGAQSIAMQSSCQELSWRKSPVRSSCQFRKMKSTFCRVSRRRLLWSGPGEGVASVRVESAGRGKPKFCGFSPTIAAAKKFGT